MKNRILFLCFMLFPILAVCQELKFDAIMGNYVQTEAGCRIAISFYTDNDNRQHYVTLNHWYKDYDGSVRGSYLVNTKDAMTRNLDQIQYKFSEWAATAKANNVSSVKKVFPIKLSFTYLTVDNIQRNPSTSTYFEVMGKEPLLEIYLYAQNLDHTVTGDCLYLTPNDIPFIIQTIDKLFVEYIKKYKEKQRVEDLFH